MPSGPRKGESREEYLERRRAYNVVLCSDPEYRARAAMRERERYQNASEEWREEQRARKRERHYLSKYGITIQERDRMAKAQSHRCAVCDVQPTGGLAVDHCHHKGHVRGLLCNNCNLAIGLLKDRAENAQAVVKYLSPEVVYEHGAGI